MKKIFLTLLSLVMVLAMTTTVAFAATAEEGTEEEEGQTWLQWHMSSGVSDINDETGIAKFENTKNGDISFARSDMKFGMNGFKMKIKNGFQDKKAADPNALVEAPVVTIDNFKTYRYGFRIHLSKKFELNDTDPQVCIRFTPFKDGDNPNKTMVNFWVSTGTGYDPGAWIFTEQNLADYYWDESKTNEISLDRRNDGKFYLTVNGKSGHFAEPKNANAPYANLDTAFSSFDQGEGYFMFWNNFGTADAAKYAPRTTIELLETNLPARFNEGNPYGFTFTQNDATWGYDSVGKLVLEAKAGKDFIITENEATRSLTGTGMKFRNKKSTGALSMNLVGDDNNLLKIKANKTDVNKADISLEVVNAGKSSIKTVKDVKFNWYGDTENDYAMNKMLVFREKSDFVVSINDVRLDGSANGLDTARLDAIMKAFPAMKLQLASAGNGEFVIDDYIAKLPATTPKGWVEGADGKTMWDSDFDGNSIVWSEDGVFSAVYKAEPALLDAFGTKVILESKEIGKKINIVLSSSPSYYKKGADAIVISLEKADGKKSNVVVSKFDKTSKKSTVLDTATITNINWDVTQEVKIQYGILEGEWKLFIRDLPVKIDSAKLKAASDAVAASCENGLAYLQIHSEGGKKNSVTFLDMLHYLPGPAVVDGIKPNSFLPIFGAAKEKGDLVMTFDKKRGDTINIVNKQVNIDGFKVDFDMFSTPKAGMGHIILALCMNTTWHSLNTGIQIAITSSSAEPLSLEKASFGLTMTDNELGLSNTPLVKYDVPFNWRGRNTIEINKDKDGKWVFKVNGKRFNESRGKVKEELENPVKKDDELVAGTITEIMDIIVTRYKGNYAYVQMWNNFGGFTIGIKDMGLMDLNTPPAAIPGITKNFKAPEGHKVRLDLKKFFKDNDGEIVKYTVDGGAKIVENNVLEFTVTANTTKKYLNVRAYDNRGDFGLIRISIEKGDLDLGNMNVDGEPNKAEAKKGGCGSVVSATASSAVVLVLVAAAVVMMLRKKKFED